jgi:DNA-binding XRE family transcriptional regulator
VALGQLCGELSDRGDLGQATSLFAAEDDEPILAAGHVIEAEDGRVDAGSPKGDRGPVLLEVRQALADLLGGAGVSTETVYSLEHGRRQPTLRTLGKIARALGVEVKDFFS